MVERVLPTFGLFILAYSLLIGFLHREQRLAGLRLLILFAVR